MSPIEPFNFGHKLHSVINRINDGVEAVIRKSQAIFKII